MKTFLKGLLSLLVAILALESLARIAATVYYDATAPDGEPVKWHQFSSEMGWIGRPGYKGPVTYRKEGVREFDSTGFLAGELGKLRDSSKTRILFIGDSNTFGYEIPEEEGMAARVESLLSNVVTVNLSIPAYSSYQGRLVTSKVLNEYSADVAVVSFNFNDRRFVGSRTEQDGPAAFARYYESFTQNQTLRTFDGSYIYRGLRFVLRSFGLVRNEYAQPSETVVDSLFPRVSPQSYRANLTAIVGELKRKNIRPLFLLLGDNPTLSVYIRRGLQFLREGKPDSAINLLRIAEVQHNSYTTLARKFLTYAYLAVGDTGKAQQYRKSVSPYRLFNGGDLIEFDSTYHEIMREVADSEEVELVDGKALLDAEPSVYYDACHFDGRGHRKIANALSVSIERGR